MWTKDKINDLGLRYYMHDGPEAFRFELAGFLDASGAKRLAQDWKTASSTVDGRVLIVDVSFVTDVDSEGEALLRDWDRNGAELVASSEEGRNLIESITGHGVRPSTSASTYEPQLGWGTRNVKGLFLAFFTLIFPAVANAAAISPQTPDAAAALARYAATAEHGSVFAGAAVLIEMEATLPSLDQHGRLIAIRRDHASGSSSYDVLASEGDSMVHRQIFARYLALNANNISPAVTPENYKFRYAGPHKTGNAVAYVFEVTPRKKRAGLMKGELWIDNDGIAIHRSGRLVKQPSLFFRRTDFSSDVELGDDATITRTTHVVIITRIAGRVELSIKETRWPQTVFTAAAMIAQKGVRP